MKKVILSFYVFFIGMTALAQTTLAPGDIAFIGTNTDGLLNSDDKVAFVLLKDIDAATTIIFTDRGWNDGVGFSSHPGDGEFTWTAAMAMTAGTVVEIDMGPLLLVNLNNAYAIQGDQLFAIQGSIASPTFIAGLQFNESAGSNDTNWDGAATDNQTSALPDALTTGNTAVRLSPEADNWQFSCAAAGGSPIIGSPSELRAILHDPSNWVSNDTMPYSPVVEALCLLIVDVTPPTAVCKDITVDLDPSGMATIVASDVDGGSTDNVGIASLSIDIDTFTCSNVGNPVSVTLTVTDLAGLTDMCTANVTVKDTVSPIALCKDITVQLDVNGMASFTTADIDNGSSDACGIADMSLDVSEFTCANIGANTVTLTVTDSAGNSSTCMATVTVEDNLAPTTVCQDITVQLDSTGMASITPADVDIGSIDNCGIASMAVSKTEFDCDDVTDPLGTLYAISGGDIYSVDPSTGVGTMVGASGFNFGSSLAFDPTLGKAYSQAGGGRDQAAEIDLATGAVLYTIPNTPSTLRGVQGLAFNGGMGYITYTGVGGGGGPAFFATWDPATGTVTDIGLTGTNNISGLAFDENGVLFGCQGGGVSTNLYTIDLDTGTASLVGDMGVVLGGIEFADGKLFGIGARSDSGNLFEIDPANGSVLNTFATGIGGAASGLTYLPGNVVILSVTDDNGNTAICTANVTVEDNVKPTTLCKDATIQLDANGMASIAPADIDNGSNDACGIAMVSLDKTDFTCDDLGDYTVTLTATDINGNSATCIATVTVEDNIPPVAVGKDITVSLDANGMATVTGADIDNGSSDNCSYVPTASPNSFDCDDIGDNTVTLTVTDPAGNADNVDVTVTVVDDLPPVVVLQELDICLDNLGFASIIPDDVIVSLNDNCTPTNGINISLSRDEFFHAAHFTVFVTAVDAIGNITHLPVLVRVTECPLPAGEEIIVYPNPTSGNFSIKIDQAWTGAFELSIVDEIGRVMFRVKEGKEDAVWRGVYTANRFNLAAGNYFIYLNTPVGFQARQLIVIE